MKASTALLTGFLFLFLAVHALMIAVFFCPTPKLITLVTGSAQEYLSLTDYPLHVRQAFSKENSLSLIQSDKNDRSPIEKLFLKSLRFRAERVFTADKKTELYLNTLDFGDGVIGLDGASRYYFQKPVSTIDVNESITLASLYQIFRN